jgi:hypothetical protein
VLSRDARHVCVTEPRRGLGHLVKHALKIEGCATYKLKHIGSTGLLFQRLVALAGDLRDVVFLIGGG